MAPFPDLTKLQDLIPILVFLLPGFVSSGIVSLLVIRKPQEAFGRAVEAVIFTALNLGVFFVAKTILVHLVSLNVTFKHLLTVNSHDFYTAGNFILLGVCAVGIGLVWSIEANNQWLFRVLQGSGITSKSTKNSIWLDVLSRPRNPYVVVHLKDGRRIMGFVRQYSDDAADRALFLEEASWLTKDGAFVNDPPISVLVDHETGVSMIEFLESREESTKVERAGATTVSARLSGKPSELVQPPSLSPGQKLGSRIWLCALVAIGYLFLELRILRYCHQRSNRRTIKAAKGGIG
jgi:Family of unknown function (DUF6338)